MTVAVLITLIGIFVVLFMWLHDKFEGLHEKLAAHDTADALLAQRVDGVEKRLDRIETKMDDGFTALNNKIDTLILNLSEKQAA